MSSAPLQVRYSLGPDPFNPHDNIHAGAAYLSELLDRYGERGFLATYNAGPKRCEDYLRGRSLPTETTDYVAQLSSELHFNELPTRYVTLPPDAAHSQIFVACEASNDRAYKGSTDSVEDIPRTEKAVRHLLLSAQRDVSILRQICIIACCSLAPRRPFRRSPSPASVPMTSLSHFRSIENVLAPLRDSSAEGAQATELRQDKRDSLWLGPEAVVVALQCIVTGCAFGAQPVILHMSLRRLQNFHLVCASSYCVTTTFVSGRAVSARRSREEQGASSREC